MDKALVHPTWAPHIKRQYFLKLRRANEHPGRSEGVILLHLQIGNPRVDVWLGVLEDLAVDLLLGTSFMDRYVRDSFSLERKRVPWRSRPFYILTQSAKAINAISFADHEYAIAPGTRHTTT